MNGIHRGVDKYEEKNVELSSRGRESNYKWMTPIDSITGSCSTWISRFLLINDFFFSPIQHEPRLLLNLHFFRRFLFISFFIFIFFLFSYYFRWMQCPYDVINTITQRADSRFPLFVPKWYGIRSRSANMRRFRWCELWTGHIILWQRQFRFVSHRIQFRQKGLINTSCWRRVNIPFTTCRIK